MTLVIGASSIVGIVTAIAWRSRASAVRATVVLLSILVAQFGALWVSFLPRIAHDELGD